MDWHKAQETFVAEMKDGSSVRVVKGDTFPDGHELVKRDKAATGMLFRPLDTGNSDEAVQDTGADETAKPAAKAAPKAAVPRGTAKG
jgi:hypothetical protein